MIAIGIVAVVNGEELWIAGNLGGRRRESQLISWLQAQDRNNAESATFVAQG